MSSLYTPAASFLNNVSPSSPLSIITPSTPLNNFSSFHSNDMSLPSFIKRAHETSVILLPHSNSSRASKNGCNSLSIACRLDRARRAPITASTTIFDVAEFISTSSNFQEYIEPSKLYQNNFSGLYIFSGTRSCILSLP